MNSFTILALAAISSIVYFAPPLLAAEADTNTVTADSIFRDLKYRHTKATHILAFRAQVDERPLYVESALLTVEFTTNKWRLVHVYRHPKEKVAHFRRWSVSVVMDAPHTGSRDFPRRPTQAEVEKFLEDTWWKFGPSEGFRLLRGEVYHDTWKKALGHEPRYGYPKPAA